MSTDNQSAQEAERQAFEKWAKVFYGPIHLNRREADPDDLDGPPDLDGQEYAHHLARYYWAGWQARSALAQAPAPSGEAPTKAEPSKREYTMGDWFRDLDDPHRNR